MLKVALSIIVFCPIAGLYEGWRPAQAQKDYEWCRAQVGHALSQNHIKKAADWADLALRLRREAHPINCVPTIVQDEWFADELITLDAAEKVFCCGQPACKSS